MPPVFSKITRANHDGSVKSIDNFYEAGLDPDLAYIISDVVSNIKSNPLQSKRKTKRRSKHPCSVCSKNVCDNQRAIQCDEYNCWSHGACNGISKLEYQNLVEEDNSAEWHCLPCLIMMRAIMICPFGYESNTELYELLSIALPSHFDPLPAFEIRSKLTDLPNFR